MPCGRRGEEPNPCGERFDGKQPQAADPSDRESGFLADFVPSALGEESEDAEDADGEEPDGEESDDEEPPDSLDGASPPAPAPEPLRVLLPEPLPLRESRRESLL